MKTYIYTLFVISLACSFRIVKTKNDFEEMVGRSVYHSNGVPQGFSKIFLNDEYVRARYIKHAGFYSKKNNRCFIQDNFLDHVVYHGVDMAVGAAMNKMSESACISEISENLSAGNKEFIVENIRLIVTAGVIKGITIQCDNGVENINEADCKMFAKSVATQITADAINNYVIKSLINHVAEKDSLTERGLQSAGNIIAIMTAIILVDQVTEK